MYRRGFLDADGNAFQLHHIEQLAHAIIRIHPVLRLRDARFIRRLRPSSLGDERKPDTRALAQQLDQLTRELVRNPQKLTNGELRQGRRPCSSCWSTTSPSRVRRWRGRAVAAANRSRMPGVRWTASTAWWLNRTAAACA